MAKVKEPAIPRQVLAREAIEGAGAELRCVPSYSPDFNPIEMTFSKIKAILRAAAKRTLDGLWDTVANALDDFRPHECQNDFCAAGYKQRDRKMLKD